MAAAGGTHLSAQLPPAPPRWRRCGCTAAQRAARTGARCRARAPAAAPRRCGHARASARAHQYRQRAPPDRAAPPRRRICGSRARPSSWSRAPPRTRRPLARAPRARCAARAPEPSLARAAALAAPPSRACAARRAQARCPRWRPTMSSRPPRRWAARATTRRQQQPPWRTQRCAASTWTRPSRRSSAPTPPPSARCWRTRSRPPRCGGGAGSARARGAQCAGACVPRPVFERGGARGS
jgi:hypothetical protein